MRKLIVFTVFVLITACALGMLYAVEDKVCPCGFDGGSGRCIPCKETEKQVKPAPEGKVLRDTECPCGYSAGGLCNPCREKDDDSDMKDEKSD